MIAGLGIACDAFESRTGFAGTADHSGDLSL
jgi:hypothetical protein